MGLNGSETSRYADNILVDRNREYPYPLSTVLPEWLPVGAICFVVPRD